MTDLKTGDFVKRKGVCYDRNWCKFCGKVGVNADTVFTIYNTKPGTIYLSLNGKTYETGFAPDKMETASEVEKKVNLDGTYIVVRDDCKNVILKGVTLEEASNHKPEGDKTYTVYKLNAVSKIGNVKTITKIK